MVIVSFLKPRWFPNCCIFFCKLHKATFSLCSEGMLKLLFLLWNNSNGLSLLWMEYYHYLTCRLVLLSLLWPYEIIFIRYTLFLSDGPEKHFVIVFDELWLLVISKFFYSFTITNEIVLASRHHDSKRMFNPHTNFYT